ncbi:MAG: hypothetical protein O3A00_11710 [Planctomycetota bacterium]|nr:hypothetical protein [Planctomycetota bacterium]
MVQSIELFAPIALCVKNDVQAFIHHATSVETRLIRSQLHTVSGRQSTPNNVKAPSDKKQDDKQSQAEKVFEKIKTMAGQWVATKGEQKGQVTFDVIAGGSAVVEREFPGTPQEMITVFHLDGNTVRVNHYCMLGNQPRYKAKFADKGTSIVFEFDGVTNLSSKDAAHMHEGKLTFTDPDNLKSTWVMFKDGKRAEEHSFEVTRKK